MSDNNDMLQLGRRGQLTANVTFLMLKGAGYAALLVFGLWLFVAVFAAIGRLLPEESRDTPDPIIRSDISAPAEPDATRLG
jgi:hypothetical protein